MTVVPPTIIGMMRQTEPLYNRETEALNEKKFYNLDVDSITNDPFENLMKVVKDEYKLDSSSVYTIFNHNGKKYLVVLQKKISSDNLRKIIDPAYAKYSFETEGFFWVKQIVDLNDVNSPLSQIGDQLNVFTVGCLHSSNFQYYRSIKAAFFLQQDVPKNYTGYWFWCNENGEKDKMSEFRNGVEIRKLRFATLHKFHLS